jgi:hypothetical protein
MPNDISRFREGKDQKSDSPTKDTSRSNGQGHDFATRPESYQAHNDLQRRGGDEQAYYELKRARKGKMLVVSDETIWHSDTQSSSEYSSGSDSEINALPGVSPSDKIILSNKPTRDKPGLLGGTGGFLDAVESDFRRVETRAVRDLQRLGMMAFRATRESNARGKAERYQHELYQDHYNLQNKFNKLDALDFNDFKREYPHADYELFDQQKKFLKEDYERTFVIMGKLGPQGWHDTKKYDKSREKKFGDRSLGGQAVYVAKWFADGQKGRSDKQRQKKFYQALSELDQKWRKLNRLTFEDFKRECPEHADYEVFNQQKKSLMKDCDRKFDIIRQLGPEGFYRMKKEEKRRARRSDREASTSGG